MSEAAVIVGGGIAGAVAAAALARQGRSPLLLERSRGAHHKVCGEFLSWDAASRLASIGFDLAALGGSAIDHVRVFSVGRMAEAALPGRATGISRHALDEALLAHAAKCGARIERGVIVRGVNPTESGFDIDGIDAKAVLLATGKTNLRGAARQTGDNVTDDLVGFKMHYRLTDRQTAALGGAVELHLLGSGGYAGLQLVEDGIANLCLLVPNDSIADPSWSAVFAAVLNAAPTLAARTEGAVALFEKPLAISGVPYGFIHKRQPCETSKFLRLGDQFAVVHSFTGDGMALATASGLLAASNAATYDTDFRRAAQRPVRISSFLGAGLRRPAMTSAALQLAAAWPGALGLAARLTRVAQ